MNIPRHELGFPTITPGLRIGLLGGSFDPPHAGHLHLTASAFRLLALDRVIWLIAPQNPLKKRTPASVERRTLRAREFVAHPRVWISNLETRIGSTHTATTIKFLGGRFPQAQFVWLMGADNLEELDRWHRWQSIICDVPIAVFPRNQHRASTMSCRIARLLNRSRLKAAQARELPEFNPPVWTFLEWPLCNISSTTIRSQGQWKN